MNFHPDMTSVAWLLALTLYLAAKEIVSLLRNRRNNPGNNSMRTVLFAIEERLRACEDYIHRDEGATSARRTEIDRRLEAIERRLERLEK